MDGNQGQKKMAHGDRRTLLRPRPQAIRLQSSHGKTSHCQQIEGIREGNRELSKLVGQPANLPSLQLKLARD